MRKLFTSFLALCATVTMNAQNASNWQPEQEVTSELEWTGVNYTGDQGAWQTAGNAGVGWFYDDSKSSSGSIEMFQNPAGAEIYQTMWLPAGYYRFTVQGFYRPSDWGKSTDQNAQFFCDVVAESEDADGNIIYNVTRENKMNLRLITSDAYESEVQLFAQAGDWQDDSRYDHDGVTAWVPNSMWGTSVYFESGRYENELYVINPEDGLVKVGIRKTDYQSSDWTIFNNFRAYYISDAGEAVQLIIAKDNVSAVMREADKLVDKYSDDYPGLATLLSDELSILEDGDEFNSTIAECEATVEKVNGLLNQYKAYTADVDRLATLVEKCKALNEKAQDATFAAAIVAGEAVLNDGVGQNEFTLESPEQYKQAADALDKARLTFITGGEPVNGAWNLSSMINNPWFCDEEFNPTYNEETGHYEFSEEIDNTWATIQEQGYSEAAAADGREDWIPICTTISSITGENLSKNQEGFWVIKSATWHGGGPVSITMQHSYPAIGGWTAEPSGNPELLYQNLTDLPNGFYSMSALMCNAGADLSPLQYAFIETATDVQKANLTMKGNPWWGGNRDAWRDGVWEKLTTGIVRVTDGKVKIGVASDAFYAATGFQLYYYGENPDFTSMVVPQIEALKAQIEDLVLDGDKAKVTEMLASIPEKINGMEEYEAAKATLDEVEQYISEANSYMSKWSVADDVTEYQNNLDEESDECKILDKVWDVALEYTSLPEATYIGAKGIENDFNAYKNYLSTRATMADMTATSSELKSLFDSQMADLKEHYATSAKIAEFIAALAAPYNAAVLTSLGGANASESNPVDITTLIVNPSYENGKTGWEGDFTVSPDYKNAESYNSPSFRAAQTVYSLPAGVYRVQVQSFYRDGGNAGVAFENYIYTETYTPNVKLFANGDSVDVVSLATGEFTEPSMTERVKEWVKDEDATEEYHDVMFGTPDYDENKVIYMPVMEYMDFDAPAYPFDDMVPDIEDYWFPNSMEGTMNRFEKSPKAYINYIDVALPEGGAITFGVQKNEGIGGDWCIFDNWKLFVVSMDPAVGISSTTAAKAGTSAIYNAAGVQQNALSRGVNIVKMSDGTVKKIVR